MISSRQFCELVNDYWNNGELMKAFTVVCNPPAVLEDDEAILTIRSHIQKHLKSLAEVQNNGMLNGHFVNALVDPPEVEKVVKFTKARDIIRRNNLKHIVDVGCFSGWVGRALSLEGIKVMGIDIHPVLLVMAAYRAAGSLAEFQLLSAAKVGLVFPRTFDGAVVFDTLEHVSDPDNAIKSINRSVKKDGWVIINVPSPKGEVEAKRHGLDEHEHLYCFSQEWLNDHFKAMKNYSLQEINNEEGGVNWFLSYQI